MASTAERQKKLQEMRARAKQKDATKDRAPFAPKKNAPASPGSKVRADNKTTPKQTGLSKRLQGDSKPSPGSKVRAEPKMAKAGKSGTMPKVMRGGTADAATKKDPLAGKPRTIAAAKKAGEKFFFDRKGVKKLAVTAEDLKKSGMTLKEYANKGFAPKKVTKAEAEKFKKKRGGGVMKKKSYAGGGKMKKKGMAMGGAMKKKGMAAGGRTTMKKQMMRGGGMTGMKKKMYAGGGKMKKGYAIGGAMKKKGMKRGGKPMKMRGGGLATRGTNFRIR